MIEVILVLPESLDGVRLFEVAGGALVRAAAYAEEVAVPSCPDLTGDPAEYAPGWCGWLRAVWANEVVVSAIEVASPVLSAQVTALCEGRVPTARQARRMALSVSRYLIRMTERATPFGLFAGVAATRFADRTVVKWGAGHRPIAQADAGWLAEVITGLEACPPLLDRLPVMVSNLCFARGDRLVVPHQPHTGPSGRVVPAQVSVRFTPAVRAAVHAARSPVRCGDLAAHLAEAFPAAPRPVIEVMLARLVAQRVLVSGLRAPVTAPDALGHVLEQLAAADAGDIAQVAPVLAGLGEVQAGLVAHNRAAAPCIGRDLRRAVTATMTALAPSEHPLKVDLRLDGEITMPDAVASEAEAAAAVLTRLTRHPFGSPAWREYHTRFVERYGIGAEVLVTDLVDDGAGLGFPAGYHGSAADPEPPGLSARDTWLLAAAQHAALAGGAEIVLDTGDIAELAAGDLTQMRIPPHVELCFEIQAASATALDRGDFWLVVVAAGRGAGTTTGRFSGLLEATGGDRVAAALARLPCADTGAAVVQVSFPPLAERSGNVTRGRVVLADRICLGEHGGGSIPVQDLAVGSDGTRLYLVSVSQRRRLEPAVFHALDFAVNTPPIARFLCEVARAQAPVYGVFDWGAAAGLPFLPRIRHRRTILSPARWNLRAADLPARDAPWPDWTSALAQWRCRAPSRLHLWEADRRLGLDLDDRAHLAVLRSHLDHAGTAVLTEAPAPRTRGWVQGRVHEIVVPLVSTRRPDPQPAANRPLGCALLGRGDGQLPGCSDWLSAKVYAAPHAHHDILTRYLPELLAAWDRAPDWWFVRYRDPDPHLRLRFGVHSPAEYGQAAAAIGTWAARLTRLSLAGTVQLDTYYPETGRYGAGPVMAAAEAVFAADSAAVIAQLAIAGGVPAEAVTAASMVDLAVAFAGGLGPGMDWLTGLALTKPATPVPSGITAAARRLAVPGADPLALASLPGGSAVLASWHKRGRALAGYRDALLAAGHSPVTVLASLLHMHHIRAAGLDPDNERVCLHLTRAAATTWTIRNQKANR